MTNSETEVTADRRWREALEGAWKRSLRVDPRKEELVLEGSKERGLSLDLEAATEVIGRGCANLVAENDIMEGRGRERRKKKGFG